MTIQEQILNTASSALDSNICRTSLAIIGLVVLFLLFPARSLSEPALIIEKVHPENGGYRVSIRLVNQGISSIYLAKSPGGTPSYLHALGIEQFNNGHWRLVSYPRDTHPNGYLMLRPHMSRQDSIMIADLPCPNLSTQICIHIDGKFRASLPYFDTKSDYRHGRHKELASSVFEISQ